MIYNQKNQKLMKNIRQKIRNHLKGLITKKRENDDPVDTDVELETNLAENAELSTSDSVARKLMENPDENVDTEEEMAFYYLTVPGNYSDYDIFGEE